MKQTLVLAILAMAAVGHAELAPVSQGGWRYTLLEGSALTDECPICGRPSIIVPLRGSFTLRLAETNPLGSRYTLDEIEFFAGSAQEPQPQYRVTGSGEFRIGGEVALTQEASMRVEIDRGGVKTDAQLASEAGVPGRLWPMIRVPLAQTNGTLTQKYTIEAAAAPLREVWFSTASGLTSETRPPPDSAVSAGDLLSSSGRIVLRNIDMTRHLGIMPVVPDLGLDAFGILPGGELTFSIESDVFSESQGPIQEGDWLSGAGTVLRTNQSLLGAFGIKPPLPDAGLDAFHEFAADEPSAGARAGEVWFSIRKDQISDGLGRILRAGDVLSDNGSVIRTNEQLLEQFRPMEPEADYGLDALHVWPSGEIWFSTQSGFVGEGSISYLAGDILSDQGYVVFRNLDILGPFNPLEDLSDFGLDAIWIVSDASAASVPPAVLSIKADHTNDDVRLFWQGGGRVFQVEGVAKFGDKWEALTPILPEREFIDLGVLARQSRRFYRVLQW